jgi:hypothetical protein
MATKTKKYLAKAGMAAILSFVLAYYNGHVADACDSTRAGMIPLIFGLVLFIATSIFLYLAPIGKTKMAKLISPIAKTVILIVFLGILYLTALNLCF